MSRVTQSSVFQRAASLVPLPLHPTLRLSSSSLDLGSFHLRMELQTREVQQPLLLRGRPSGTGKTIYWPARFGHLVKGVKVHIPTGLTFFDARLIVQSGQIYEEAHSSALQNRVGSPPRRISKIYATGEYFVVPTIHAYWHWVVEWLPRVLGVKATNKDVTILTTARQPAYVREGLGLLGVGVEYIDEIWAQVDNLWVVDKAFFGYIHTDDLRAVREFGKTIAKGCNPSGSPSSKVYVSRRGFSRPMAKEAELEEWLESEGFTIFRANELTSVTIQARLFASAELLVAPTGSSLCNVVFMPPGSKVIELSVWHQNWPECESLSTSSGVFHEKVIMKATEYMQYGDGKEAIQLLKKTLNMR